jgi:hypothetical protein
LTCCGLSVTIRNTIVEPLDAFAVFRWPVPQAGYRWIQGIAIDPSDVRRSRERGAQALLTDGVPIGSRQAPARAYEPLRTEPALFLTFANLRPTQGAIKGFADRYGRLGAELWFLDRDGPQLAVEPRALWRREIQAMRAAVESWRSEDPARLRGIQASVNHRFKGGGVSPVLLYSEDPPRLRLAMRPHCLLDALWWQLARAVQGRGPISYIRCPVCERFFEVSLDPMGRRRDAKYCSNACRQRAWRVRKGRER